MNGSDKRLENLASKIAKSKMGKKKSSKVGDDMPKGKPNKPNPFVDIDDQAANVARYGRKFTGPKGSKGTSYVLPKKSKGKK